MVVHNIDVFGAVVSPAKNQAPLIVDANTALAFAFSGQALEPIGWPSDQIRKRRGGVKILKSVLCLFLDGAKALCFLALEQGAGILALEAPDHVERVVHGTRDVKRTAFQRQKSFYVRRPLQPQAAAKTPSHRYRSSIEKMLSNSNNLGTTVNRHRNSDQRAGVMRKFKINRRRARTHVDSARGEPFEAC